MALRASPRGQHTVVAVSTAVSTAAVGRLTTLWTAVVWVHGGDSSRDGHGLSNFVISAGQ